MLRRVTLAAMISFVWLSAATAVLAAPRPAQEQPPAEPTYAGGYALLLLCVVMAVLGLGRPHARAKSAHEVREEAPLWKRLLGKKSEPK